MPTYQYLCTSCGRDLEIRQSFSDPSLTVCPECEGSLRKVFNAVGVVFKGSGFYKTDSRSGSSATIPANSSSASSSDGSSSEAASTKDASTKDAATKAPSDAKASSAGASSAPVTSGAATS